MAKDSVREYDPNGWFEIPDTPISRAGIFPYTAKSIAAPGWEQEPNRIYNVYRPAEELAHPETVESARLIPWTDDHAMLGDPDVTQGVVAPEEKGVHGTTGERVYFRDGSLFANIKLWSKNLAALIASGKKELSCGFRCVYEFAHGDFGGQPFDAIQRQIRFNHFASVYAGRMGPGTAVFDRAVFSFDAKEAVMKRKIKVRDRLARNFGMDAAIAAKILTGQAMDAETEEEEGDGAKAVTLDDVAKMLGEIAPQLAKIGEIQEQLGKLMAAPGADDDMEPVLDSAGKPCMDDNGKPKMQKKAKPAAGAAMDAALAPIKAQLAEVTGKLGALPTIKSVMAEIRTRDSLATRVADFVGTFDHAEMTTAEVAKYGCDKLGLKPTTGAEVTALDAYLKDRQPPHRAQSYVVSGADSAVAAGDKNPAVEYMKQAAR